MEALARFFAQRKAVLASHEADLGVLKQLDRRFLGELAQGQLGPVSLPGLSAATLLAEAADPLEAMVVVEGRDCLWPGELSRLHQALCAIDQGQPLAWWLAACYPALPMPKGDGGWLQARACWLRQKPLEGPWQDWLLATRGEQLGKLVPALWALCAGHQWQYWLPSLWQQASEAEVVASINALAPQVDEVTLVELMGRSHLGRFLPWLGTLRQPQLSEVVMENQLYLTGGDNKRIAERQCWGQALEGDWLKLAPAQLTLKFRQRLWALVGRDGRGAPWSLFGGRLCLGN